MFQFFFLVVCLILFCHVHDASALFSRLGGAAGKRVASPYPGLFGVFANTAGHFDHARVLSAAARPKYAAARTKGGKGLTLRRDRAPSRFDLALKTEPLAFLPAAYDEEMKIPKSVDFDLSSRRVFDSLPLESLPDGYADELKEHEELAEKPVMKDEHWIDLIKRVNAQAAALAPRETNSFSQYVSMVETEVAKEQKWFRLSLPTFEVVQDWFHALRNGKSPEFFDDMCQVYEMKKQLREKHERNSGYGFYRSTQDRIDKRRAAELKKTSSTVHCKQDSRLFYLVLAVVVVYVYAQAN